MITTAKLSHTIYMGPIIVNPAMVAAAVPFGRFTMVCLFGDWLILGLSFNQYYQAANSTSSTMRFLWDREFENLIMKDLVEAGIIQQPQESSE